ncbi:hypothetical protein A464_plas0089 (plasmid) [Salmonella bongori N268-08]|uniref:Uncharacterized protein n=1 Tax=Salmonella bongori N268-08 TaxID=1197719 RepID=S5N4C9_SALBN|nr:hypothetical protein A464_plas0089 [Salmonella bongori N268-08]
MFAAVFVTLASAARRTVTTFLDLKKTFRQTVGRLFTRL